MVGSHVPGDGEDPRPEPVAVAQAVQLFVGAGERFLYDVAGVLLTDAGPSGDEPRTGVPPERGLERVTTARQPRVNERAIAALHNSHPPLLPPPWPFPPATTSPRS